MKLLAEVIEQLARKKIVKDPDTILSLIPDNSIVAMSGFNMITAPEFLIERLYKLYIKTGHPKKLFLISDTFPGAPGRGLDRIAKMIYERKDEDFIDGTLFPYYGWSESLQKMVREEWFDAYAWSIGIMAYWFREVGSGRPGVLTKVGLYTTADPRFDGTAINEKGKKMRRVKVHLINIDGEEFLLYTAPKPQFALLRATTADEMGNLSLEDEAAYGTVLNIAQTIKAMPNKGVNIAQVLRIARYGSINPKDVEVPGPLVDYVVISPREYHWQSASFDYDPSVSGKIIPPLSRESLTQVELNHRKIIARRVMLELLELLKKYGRQVIVNLGVGIPATVADVAVEEEVQDLIVLTVESGTWGGKPLYGADFGASIGPFAILSVPDQFTMYEGGIIDAASLGFMQVDKYGNVNSFIMPSRLPGPGGFPAIAAGSPQIFFAGEFTAGDRVIEIHDGKLKIIKDGDIIKFVKEVYRVGCSGKILSRANKNALYITERAVFKKADEGIELLEIAPGIDLEKDILNKMEFKPIIIKEPKLMDQRIFYPRRMGIKEEAIEAIKR
ncbi:acyl CoA:acetate/3-ketoacid CoA transferase [Caldisphaera lagunensis DSM 15908]|uniref:Acyl CoA:acetate/3-ketoacid CoA transferase n=1 Tax=Caldisphaera lagunensis (strain DSM 15908 / JCM 11604 / ANMR 0165 / IC-154) TaxID=1056495 RepID=L0A7G0_CALLD|nr:CoA-transferase [Caldisphaera lagunensis]AFZ69808.1 acyl CoA:acetate/3-ketoacid CoA transferase [Caldisphaera lagunensis DSM 15908]